MSSGEKKGDKHVRSENGITEVSNTRIRMYPCGKYAELIMHENAYDEYCVNGYTHGRVYIWNVKACTIKGLLKLQ